MLAEVLRCLQPAAGDVAVDCTLGGGGHAQAILEAVQPGGRLLGIDIDPFELPRTEARLRAAGFGTDTFIARHGNFADLPRLLAADGISCVDVILADLGLSSMQADNSGRGFSYKVAGPLDMRMNASRGEPAWQLLNRLSEDDLATLLTENADEPHARLVAAMLKEKPIKTTNGVERLVRVGLSTALPELTKTEVKMSVRRTFQAIRIAVNDEFAALDALLRSLPQCLASGGRAAILTFHSGEDRRVKKSFAAGRAAGFYAQISDEVIRPSAAEQNANPRSSSAKLRWARRSI
jgi:16S rRNA (cytosine1402-N4)-methyltransferase